MGKYYDVIAGMRLAFEKSKGRELLKWSAGYFFAEMILVAAYLAILILTIAGRGDESMPFTPIWFMQQGLEGIYRLATIALGLYFVPRIVGAALATAGMKQKVPSIIDWAIFSLKRALIDLACWYDKKLLVPAGVFFAVGVLALLLAVAGVATEAMGVLAFLAAVFGFIAWIIAIMVHSIRTRFSLFMRVRGDREGDGTIRKSYDLVLGQTVEVFMAFVIFWFIIFIFAIVALVLAIIAGMAAVLIISALPEIVAVGATLAGVLAVLLAFVVLSIWMQAYEKTFEADVFKFYEKNGTATAKKVPEMQKKGAKNAKKRI